MSDTELRGAIDAMAREISARLTDAPTIYITGSVASGDYRHGWSDIDMLCLTKNPLTDAEAEALVGLREELGGGYFREFEGGILHADAFFRCAKTKAVYWGTRGSRIADSFALDPFSRAELLERGVLACGDDVRGAMSMPKRSELIRAVRRHCAAIRDCAGSTGANLYAFGWLLDISRCLYTLETGRVLPKTLAGEWALARRLCPVPDALARAVELRKAPGAFKADETAGLDAQILRYNEILERALNMKAQPAKDDDIPGWLNLAARLADNFPGLYLPDYAETLRRNIARGTALCVKQNGEIIAVLLYSTRQMCLSCMCVDPEYRRLGAASALVSEMLARMPEGGVSVTTFRGGDPLGTAPRALYESLGFEPAELLTEFDYPVQKYVLKAEKRRK